MNRKNQRFRKATSDRSGFYGLEIELINDEGVEVFGDEFDEPPPSRQSLGGEGEVSTSPYQRTTTNLTIDQDRATPVLYVTAVGGVSVQINHPFLNIVGSNQNITVSANPQITRGLQSQILTLYGVGSTVTFTNGNGVSTLGSAPMVIGSGTVINFIYLTGGNVWQVTSIAQEAFGG